MAILEFFLPLWQGHLFSAEVRVGGCPYFPWPALDDSITEHGDDHHKEEVAGVH